MFRTLHQVLRLSRAPGEGGAGTPPRQRKMVLVAETGCDLTPERAGELGVYLVPMHVSMGLETRPDGSFPPEEVCTYYDRTGDVPQTSAASQYDFERVFNEIESLNPGADIVHLAYSASTTASFHNALMAAAGSGYRVLSVDTKHVSVGQAAVVIEAARLLREHPELTPELLGAAAERIAVKTHMCFVPQNLDYLRAGGRVSNAAALISGVLNLHPCISVSDGRLVAGRKYRGSMAKVARRLIRDEAQAHNFRRDMLYFIRSPGLPDEVRKAAEDEARSCGFERTEWVRTGCVITCHGGPGAFGVVGFSR